MKDEITIPAGMRKAISDYTDVIISVSDLRNLLQDLQLELELVRYVLSYTINDACNAGLIDHETTCVELLGELMK